MSAQKWRTWQYAIETFDDVPTTPEEWDRCAPSMQCYLAADARMVAELATEQHHEPAASDITAQPVVVVVRNTEDGTITRWLVSFVVGYQGSVFAWYAEEVLDGNA